VPEARSHYRTAKSVRHAILCIHFLLGFFLHFFSCLYFFLSLDSLWDEQYPEAWGNGGRTYLYPIDSSVGKIACRSEDNRGGRETKQELPGLQA